MPRPGLLLLLALTVPGRVAAQSFPDLREFAHCLPGASWTHRPAPVELGYVRPYDLPQLHGSHLGIHRELRAGMSLGGGLEWLRAGPVEHRRPRLGLRFESSSLALGALWTWEWVEVGGRSARPSTRGRVHFRWRWGMLRVAGRWRPHSSAPRPLPSPAELVLGLSRRSWEIALRRRPSPWRQESVWEGGLLADVGPGVGLGLRLHAADATFHLAWGESGRHLRMALTVDGPRARGLAVSVEWGR